MSPLDIPVIFLKPGGLELVRVDLDLLALEEPGHALDVVAHHLPSHVIGMVVGREHRHRFQIARSDVIEQGVDRPRGVHERDLPGAR